jgi:uncharacterized RmlC-like cupin family protein
MREHDHIELVAPSDRTAGPPTPGMERQEAFASDRVWAGLVRAEPGVESGWHHHGDHETIVYVLSGALRIETGASQGIDAGPGDFVRVPRSVVHREINRSAEAGEVIVVRCGQGPSNVNVDRP